MKALRIPFLLLLLCATLLCACSRQKLAFHEADAPHHFKELKTIEILLETQPEAALDSINVLRIRDEQKPFVEIFFSQEIVMELRFFVLLQRRYG